MEPLGITQAQVEVLVKLAEGDQLYADPLPPPHVYLVRKGGGIQSLWPTTLTGLVRRGLVEVENRAAQTRYGLTARGRALYERYYAVGAGR
jgi:hypothetical protein